MHRDRVMGLLTRRADGELSGWCWSPDRAGVRLTVEILADNEVLDQFVADEMSYELQRQGFGDGRHTFRNKPDPSPSGARLLSARERETGLVFGQVRLADRNPPDARVLRLAADLQELRARLSAMPRTRGAPGGQVRRGFGHVGERLAQRPDDAIASARLALTRALAGVALPMHDEPACSVVLLTRDARRTTQGVRALAPALAGAVGATPAELVILDMGGDAATSLLPAVLPSATHVAFRTPPTLSDALAGALDATRARRFLLIKWPDSAASAAALADLLECEAPLVIGQGPAALASALGWRDAIARAPSVPPCTGFLLATDTALLRTMGGLDPAFDDAPDAAVLDFSRKAALLGTPTVALDQARRGPASPPIDGAARALLTARWARASERGHG